MTAMLQPIAPMAVLLEGGYNLSATAAATEACLRVLLGERPAALPFQDRAPSASGMAVIQNVIRTQVWTECCSCLASTAMPSADATFRCIAAEAVHALLSPDKPRQLWVKTCCSWLCHLEEL